MAMTRARSANARRGNTITLLAICAICLHITNAPTNTRTRNYGVVGAAAAEQCAAFGSARGSARPKQPVREWIRWSMPGFQSKRKTSSGKHVTRNGTVALDDAAALRAEALHTFHASWTAYKELAYPMDALDPSTCSGQNEYGGLAMTALDSLDMLLLADRAHDFDEVSQHVERRNSEGTPWANGYRVNVFEVTIRALGGLLSAHAMLVHNEKSTVGQKTTPRQLNSILYTQQHAEAARHITDLLVPAFNTPTGIPLPWVYLAEQGTGDASLRRNPACAAGAGSLLLEWAYLSHVTGDGRYRTYARRALGAIANRVSTTTGLPGNTIDLNTGQWMRDDTGPGAGVDSFYEYLLKGYLMLGEPGLLRAFANRHANATRWMSASDVAADDTAASNGSVNASNSEAFVSTHGVPWLMDVSVSTGRVSGPWVGSLAGFWPAMRAHAGLGGIGSMAARLMRGYHATWNFFGGLPELFAPQYRGSGSGGGGGDASAAGASSSSSSKVESHAWSPMYAPSAHPNQNSYPLRPELVESAASLAAHEAHALAAYAVASAEVSRREAEGRTLPPHIKSLLSAYETVHGGSAAALAMLNLTQAVARDVQDVLLTRCSSVCASKYALINGMSNVVRGTHSGSAIESFLFSETLKYLLVIWQGDNREGYALMRHYVFTTEGHLLPPLRRDAALEEPPSGDSKAPLDEEADMWTSWAEIPDDFDDSTALEQSLFENSPPSEVPPGCAAACLAAVAGPGVCTADVTDRERLRRFAHVRAQPISCMLLLRRRCAACVVSHNALEDERAAARASPKWPPAGGAAVSVQHPAQSSSRRARDTQQCTSGGDDVDEEEVEGDEEEVAQGEQKAEKEALTVTARFACGLGGGDVAMCTQVALDGQFSLEEAAAIVAEAVEERGQCPHHSKSPAGISLLKHVDRTSTANAAVASADDAVAYAAADDAAAASKAELGSVAKTAADERTVLIVRLVQNAADANAGADATLRTITWPHLLDFLNRKSPAIAWRDERPAMTASFGPSPRPVSLAEFERLKQLTFGDAYGGARQLLRRMVWANPADACGYNSNSDDMRGAMAIVMRGGCTFAAKARILQSAGAVEMVVVDNVEDSAEGLLRMGMDEEEAEPGIPSAIVGHSALTRLKPEDVSSNNLYGYLSRGAPTSGTLSAATPQASAKSPSQAYRLEVEATDVRHLAKLNVADVVLALQRALQGGGL
ncbi:alpha-1,2-Mannosidase [Pycnococcus provasolii]